MIATPERIDMESRYNRNKEWNGSMEMGISWECLWLNGFMAHLFDEF